MADEEKDFRSLPHDAMTERAILGAAMLNSAALAQVLSLLVASDFYLPQHEAIFDAMARMYEADEPVEPGTLHAKLHAEGSLRRVGAGGYLHTLMEAAPVALTQKNVTWYAGQVAEMAQRRALIAVGLEVAQKAGTVNGATADEIITWGLAKINEVMVGTGDSNPADHLTEADVMGPVPPYRWVIPGLLEHGDRLMLTGGEGWGKTTLVRQIAVCAAAGLHPFTFRRVEPARVLVVDCENGRPLTMRRYRPLLKAATEHGEGVADRWVLHMQPGGIDLTQRAGSAWLLRRVQKHRPDLIVIGPLYRLHFGDPNDEREARRVAAALDRARELFGSAVLLEAHSPHQQPGTKTRGVRPVGSSLWMRWPDFGYGLQRAQEEHSLHFRNTVVVPWRGARDERDWPKRLRSGEPWPWVMDEEGR